MSAARAHSSSKRFLIAVLVYAAAIFAVSHVPGRELARLGVHVWDKAAHAAEYVPLGALLMLWLTSRFGRGARRTHGRSFAIVVGLVIIYGALDEIHQLFIPGRSSSWSDVAADLLGGVIGASVTLAFRRRSAGGGPEPLGELDADEEEQRVELLSGDPGGLDDRRDRE
ncbi:MAG: VanZ family protein [Proteobacteria bacterium]|jgi:VanZ family protein|nr:VanZ family protein [Pseudomonadota bacterium]